MIRTIRTVLSEITLLEGLQITRFSVTVKYKII